MSAAGSDNESSQPPGEHAIINSNGGAPNALNQSMAQLSFQKMANEKRGSYGGFKRYMDQQSRGVNKDN